MRIKLRKMNWIKFEGHNWKKRLKKQLKIKRIKD